MSYFTCYVFYVLLFWALVSGRLTLCVPWLLSLNLIHSFIHSSIHPSIHSVYGVMQDSTSATTGRAIRRRHKSSGHLVSAAPHRDAGCLQEAERRGLPACLVSSLDHRRCAARHSSVPVCSLAAWQCSGPAGIKIQLSAVGRLGRNQWHWLVCMMCIVNNTFNALPRSAAWTCHLHLLL